MQRLGYRCVAAQVLSVGGLYAHKQSFATPVRTPRRLATPLPSGTAGSEHSQLSTEGASTGGLSTATAAAGGGSLASVKITRAPKKRSTLANIRQKPLFPGMFRHVTRFEGEHVYHYGKHTFTILKESSGIAVLPGGCLFAYCLSWLPGCPVMPLSVQLGYLGCLAIVSRLVSRGWVNHMTKDLSGRTVVITGGTSGIGKATAAQLAKMGANITLLAPDRPEHVEPALRYINKHKKHMNPQEAASQGLAARQTSAVIDTQPHQIIEFHALDLADFIAVRDFCKKWRNEGRPIDILVNSAGVLQQKQATTRFGDDVQLAVNYLGPYLLTEGLLPAVEAAQGRVVYVSCSAHVGVKGNIVNTYLTGRGVWSPRVANKFDGLEQYGFTKLGNIYHAQDLALRSYPEAVKRSVNQRLTDQKDLRLRPATDNKSAAELAMERNLEPCFTTCACTPGGVITNIYRDVPLAGVFRYAYYALLVIMRTAWEGSQTVVNCCVRDQLKNGGYYMNTSYQPAALSKAACSAHERQQVMAWTRKKMQPYMRWE